MHEWIDFLVRMLRGYNWIKAKTFRCKQYINAFALSAFITCSSIKILPLVILFLSQSLEN